MVETFFFSILTAITGMLVVFFVLSLLSTLMALMTRVGTRAHQGTPQSNAQSQPAGTTNESGGTAPPTKKQTRAQTKEPDEQTLVLVAAAAEMHRTQDEMSISALPWVKSVG